MCSTQYYPRVENPYIYIYTSCIYTPCSRCTINSNVTGPCDVPLLMSNRAPYLCCMDRPEQRVALYKTLKHLRLIYFVSHLKDKKNVLQRNSEVSINTCRWFIPNIIYSTYLYLSRGTIQKPEISSNSWCFTNMLAMIYINTITLLFKHLTTGLFTEINSFSRKLWVDIVIIHFIFKILPV